MTDPRILIIEDENILRSLYRRVLTPMGYAPLFAATLSEGIKILSGLDRLDLLISDICLPDGNGTDAIKIARQKFPAAGVMVVTGLPPEGAPLGSGSELGLTSSDIMYKPLDISAFEAEIRRRVGGESSVKDRP